MEEVWKDVAGYEGLYQVSNLGRIKSMERYCKDRSSVRLIPETFKKASLSGTEKNGQHYLQVALFKDGKRRLYRIHRIVAEMFIPNPENKEVVNHKNGNKHDNRVDNLEWCTNAENNAHAISTGLHKTIINGKNSVAICQCDKERNVIAEYPSMMEAERQTGIAHQNISAAIRKGISAGGFVWKKK